MDLLSKNLKLPQNGNTPLTAKRGTDENTPISSLTSQHTV